MTAKQIGFRITKSNELEGTFSAHRENGGGWLENTDFDLFIVKGDAARVLLLIVVNSSLDANDIVNEFKNVFNRYIVVLP